MKTKKIKGRCKKIDRIGGFQREVSKGSESTAMYGL